MLGMHCHLVAAMLATQLVTAQSTCPLLGCRSTLGLFPNSFLFARCYRIDHLGLALPLTDRLGVITSVEFSDPISSYLSWLSVSTSTDSP